MLMTPLALVVGLGGMVALIVRVRRSRPCSGASPCIRPPPRLRERIRGVRGAVREREIPWSHVREYHADVPAYGELKYIRLWMRI